MDIGFSEGQELLRDTARKFLDSACTTRFVERMATEEAVHDLHLYLKRAKACEVAFGDATWHRERVARLIGGDA